MTTAPVFTTSPRSQGPCGIFLANATRALGWSEYPALGNSLLSVCINPPTSPARPTLLFLNVSSTEMSCNAVVINATATGDVNRALTYW